jgi:hypothetical protein
MAETDQLEHSQTVGESFIDDLWRSSSVKPHLNIEEPLPVFAKDADPNGRARGSANIRSVQNEVKIQVNGNIV